MPQSIPFNPVRATVLHQQLQEECSKKAWRLAIANAMSRWEAEGNKVKRLRVIRPTVLRKLRSGYID